MGNARDLANVVNDDGSSYVGFLQAGVNAVTRTAQSKMRDVVSVFDFMTSAQIADVQAGTALVDVTAAIQTAVTAASGKTLFFPAGGYYVSGDIALPLQISLLGEGYRTSRLVSSSGVSTITVSGGVVSGSGSDVGLESIGLTNIRLRIFNYVAWLRVIECLFAANAQTFKAIDSINSSVFGGDPTRTDNVEIYNNRFFGVEYGVNLEQPYSEVKVLNNFFSTIIYRAVFIGLPVSASLQEHAVVAGNTIVGVGAGATVAYIAGIMVDGRNVEVHDNFLKDIKNSSYWEVDGIYTKGLTGRITNNMLVNAGYRSAIQNKELDLNGTTQCQGFLIDGNKIYFDESGTGYSGVLDRVFVGRTNIYGGINCVSSNTTITNNMIVGAGYPIYNVNSTTAWLMDNITISDNTIVKPRGSFGIFLTGAGNRWSVSNNKVIDPTKTLSGHLSTFSGVAATLNNSYYSTSGLWVDSNATYIARKVTDLVVSENTVDIDITLASSVYGMTFEARDSWAGGAMPTYPASFDRLVVIDNALSISNAGAGSGYGILAQEQVARFVNSKFASNTIREKTASVYPALLAPGGTWTPEVADASTGGNVATLTTAVGYYTVQENLVTVFFKIVMSSKGAMVAGNGVRLRGLPFTCASLADFVSSGSVQLANVTFADYVSPRIGAGSNVLFLVKSSTGGATSNIAVSDLANNSAFEGTITYRI